MERYVPIPGRYFLPCHLNPHFFSIVYLSGTIFSSEFGFEITSIAHYACYSNLGSRFCALVLDTHDDT